MEINQLTKKTRHTETSEAALKKIYATLNSKRGLLREDENQVLTVRRIANNPPQEIPDAVLHKLLLSKDQCNDLQLLQDLCEVIVKAMQQINVVSNNHELRLPPLYLFELTDYLMRIDVLIRAAKTAAKRLGVEAVQPKVNTDYVYRVLQKDALNQRLKNVQAA